MTRLDHLRSWWRHHDLPSEFRRYALVGTLNAAIFLALFNAITPSDASRGRTVAGAAVVVLITSAISFLLNKRWAFRDRSREGVAQQYLIFLGSTVIGIGLGLGAMALTLIPLHRFGRLGHNAAAIATAPVSVTWNFLAYRTWAFKGRARNSDRPSRAATAEGTAE